MIKFKMRSFASIYTTNSRLVFIHSIKRRNEIEEFLKGIDDSSVGIRLHSRGVGPATSSLESPERHIVPMLFLPLLSLRVSYFM